jgi:hypothetical protein
MDDGMEVGHGPDAEPALAVQAPALEQLGIDRVQVLRTKALDREVAQARDQVTPDVALVALPGRRADRGPDRRQPCGQELAVGGPGWLDEVAPVQPPELVGQPPAGVLLGREPALGELLALAGGRVPADVDHDRPGGATTADRAPGHQRPPPSRNASTPAVSC